MTSKQLLHAMAYINEDYIAGAAPTGKRRRPWLKWASLAACLCLCVGVGTAWLRTRTPATVGPTVSPDGVTIPQMEVTLSSSVGSSADMIAFFIYEGRSYVAYEYLEGADIVGEYVGTSTGLIDEWTKSDGYVDFAGSIGGDFYTVKGYDTSFMLCMPMKNEALTLLFVNNNGITLKTGEDLYGQRLHLAKRYVRVEAETRQSWYHGEDRIYAVGEEHREVLDRFVQALYDAPVMLTNDIPLRDGCSNVYEQEIYHMFFYTAEEMPIHLRLVDGGYVILQSLFEVCVKVDDTVFAELVNALQKCGA